MNKFSFFLKIFAMYLIIGLSIINAGTYIRVNQVGFYPNDSKSAFVLSTKDLSKKVFYVKNSSDNSSAYKNNIGISKGKYGNFPYIYEINFSDFNKNGTFYIEIANSKSLVFQIGNNLYRDIPSNLIDFFKVQRCGYTDPLLHKICHIADATSIISPHQTLNLKHDVTGGWHDAGDYTKFLNTTAFSTYLMLFSWEVDPSKFSFDNNNNGIEDILEEAKIGLDWLLRASYNSNKLITQVQDEDDQNVGWRMPGNDPLEFDRPGFVGIGKNLIGIYSAVLSLGYRIWKDRFHYDKFANKLLRQAKDYYQLIDKVQDLDNSGTGKYIDKKFYGKLALGAVELYLSTKNGSYLNDAKRYADSAKSDYWWSWGDINSLADYKLSTIDKNYVKYIKNNLEHFSNLQDSSLFNMGAALSWGTNQALLGVCLQEILYEKLTLDKSYRNLAINQRDFILGKNPWGISFVYGIGSNYTKHFHHQVAFFNNGKLPGGVSAGPISPQLFDQYKIELSEPDKLKLFQSKDMIYHDDRMDYLSNEPTISTNATALFVFGFYSRN